MKWTFFLTQFVTIVLAPIVLYALETTPPPGFAEQHSDLAVWVFGLVLGGFLFLIYRMIRQNDEAFKQNKTEHEAMMEAMRDESEKKWQAIGNLTRDTGVIASELNRLKGEHDVLKSVHMHKRATD